MNQLALRKSHSHTGLFAGVVVSALIYFGLQHTELNQNAAIAGSIISLMIVCWLTETIPIAATALIPLVMFPIFQIGTIKSVAGHYSHPIIFMFLGGFMISIAMQNWKLHRRLALTIISYVGSNPRSMLLGFMISSAFLSMWISNTATTLMMLPIALSVAEINSEQSEGNNFTQALLLGIAYSTSIGGMSTLIGTPPNAFMAGFVHERLQYEITFSEWIKIGLPITLMGLPLCYYIFSRFLFEIPEKEEDLNGTLISQYLELLGPVKSAERRLFLVFILTVVLWLSRPLLQHLLPGLSDAGIAIFASLLLFTLPSGDKEQPRLLQWEWNKELPWGLLLLFGSGLSIADALNQTGLATWLGGLLNLSQNMPPIVLMFIVSFSMLMLTEITSNTAATATFLPIMAALSEQLNINPLLLIVPATLSASCAFMLPIATPPNAIVYGTGQVQLKSMMRIGFWLNLVFCTLITIACYFLIG